MDCLIYEEDNEITPACFENQKQWILNQSGDSKLFCTRKSKQKKTKISSVFHKKENPVLKRLIRKSKVNNIVQTYCKKLKLNLINRPPLEFNIQKVDSKNFLDKFINDKEGYELTILQITICNIINSIITILLSLYFSAALVFTQIQQHSIFAYLEIVAIFFYVIEVIRNFIAKKNQNGNELKKIKQIVANYLKRKFIVDIMIILILILDVISKDHYQFKILRIVTVIKIWSSCTKLKQIENIYITTTLREQYWGLVTVFIINFSFAHILAISLNAMAFLETNNWLVKANLTHAMWYEKYIWGYYWGTTTMLTVGYGDFSATNYKEAICLIFIEMISCITLSYNINYVGNLVNNIRQQSIDKDKSLKIFQQMSSKNKISNELESRVKNYIDKSYQIRKEFNFAEEDKVLDSLPENIKRDYLKETNIKMFKQMTFLKDLTSRTQSLLASKLKRQIMHPEQIIHRKQEEQKLLILNQGEIGFRTKNSTGSKNDAVVETIVVNEKSPQPKLISLGFIASIKLSYEIRSLSYSVLFYIEKQDLIEVLKNYNRDYERYCEFRDDSEISPNVIELYQCEFCKNEYHSKFNCSRLHYIPIKQQVVFKYLHKIKIDKQNRICVNRKPKQKNSSLKYVFQIQKIAKDYLKVIQSDDSAQFLKSLQQKISSETYEVNSDEIKNSTFIRFHTTLNKYSKLPMSLIKSNFHQQKNELAQLIKQMNAKQVNFWTVETDSIYNWKFYRQNANLKSKQLKSNKKNKHRWS